MKYYAQMVELGCFSSKTLAKALNCCEASSTSIIQSYMKKGYIERVCHNLYIAISIETKQPVLSRYQIGSRLFPDAFLSHHSAFEVYGYANQVFYETYIATNSRFRDFEYNGVFYHRVAPKKNQSIVNINGVRTTEIEQTVIDSINDMEKIGGLEETLRCILLIPSLDEKKLLCALSEYNNGFLYQKCGYILEGLNSSLHLSKKFFKTCQSNISEAKRYITKEHNDFVWHEKWRLYAPVNVEKIIDKGVSDYDAI